MLTLNNIKKLESTYIGKWEVMGAEVDYKRTSNAKDHNYNIRLTRRDKTSIGAAIFIERIAGEFGYNVSICYEKYDNIISITPWPKDRLLNKLNYFRDNKQEYNKLGIPYSLGILLHGLPGTGKTSTIKAIANYLKRNIVLLKLNEINTNKLIETDKNIFEKIKTFDAKFSVEINKIRK
jgi:Cdc6-like AAA superfamily ATPase